MDTKQKQNLIESVAHGLDIAPIMYERAKSVIDGLTNYLKFSNNNIEIYKQGSFKLGTIVKPYQKDKDGDFDIDLVVQFSTSKNETTPKEIKALLRKYLNDSEYEQYLDKEGKRCWTLNYPHIKGTDKKSFHIDLLPCVKETIQIQPVQYQNTAIAISNTDKKTTPYIYEWHSSNPKGLAEWFDCVNYGKYKQVKANDRKRLVESFGQLFSTMDEVTISEYTRSPLQKVIQILKRHRDVMFTNTDKEDFKPISLILTVLAGKIVEENNIVENNTYELLNTILKGFEYYASLQNSGITSDYADEYKTKQLISKTIRDGKAYWSIKNPTNASENIADRWNTNGQYATEFFRWVKQAQNDLVDILENEKSTDIIAKLKDCLGEEISDVLNKFNFNLTLRPKEYQFNTTTPKPYGAMVRKV